MLSLLLALSHPAHAFCGTYVGQAGADLYNSASQLAFVRQGTTTTLTLANDYAGSVTDFALVIPVPQVLSAEDVTTVDSALFAELDRYSGPRLVSYTCEDFAPDTGWWDDSAAPQEDGGSGESSDSVTIEAEFSAGEYHFVVLSAEESGSLLTWLDDHGYAVSTDAETLLQEYIDAGSYFLAAQVQLEQIPPDSSFLSPIRIRYEASTLSLPIRLGTLNAQGAQDLIIYGINDVDQGELLISNYPQVSVEDECMLSESASADFSAAWLANVDAAFDGQAGWILEYAWAPYHCDPCPDGEALSDQVLQDLGYNGTGFDAMFTRLHVRYTPEQATEDLSLYASGVYDQTQVRYITYNHDLESLFPICGVGMVPADEAGVCVYGDSTDDTGDTGEWHPVRKACGCASGAATPWGLGALLGLALTRRRSRR